MNRKTTMNVAGAAEHVMTSIRIALFTLVVCSILYPLAIFGIGQIFIPHRAEGSLVLNDQGEIVGSTLIAQGFSKPGYFWPRPSAVAYHAEAAGGSNLSPTNPELRNLAEAELARFSRAPGTPIPADLVSASGSGLDPDITLSAARFQADRVASARGLSVESVMELVMNCARRRSDQALISSPLVNVLQANMELDKVAKSDGR
jgi:potassium-transporting ATPase KdpC subunit